MEKQKIISKLSSLGWDFSAFLIISIVFNFLINYIYKTDFSWLIAAIIGVLGGLALSKFSLAGKSIESDTPSEINKVAKELGELTLLLAGSSKSEMAALKKILTAKLSEELDDEKIPVESLSDNSIIKLTKFQMSAEKQKILAELLEKNQEADLTEAEKQQLDSLMEDYDKGLLRKSEALSIAVERGLIEPLSK